MTILANESAAYPLKSTDGYENLLEVRALKKHFPVKNGFFKRAIGQIKAVDGISFEVKRGETFGLVGESGCGKSTAGRTVIRLYEPTAGQIIFAGQDVSRAREQELKDFRRQVQMVFQDPYSSLNPRKTVRTILTEPFAVHDLYDRVEWADRAAELMQRVGLDASLINRYPHEFSGGQRQRIGIARALALKPKMIIGDEPVSALDVSIQSQVLNIMTELQAEFSLTYLFISHDLAVVKHISNRIGVMYLGHLVEVADKDLLYQAPLHPYTQALLSAIPRAHPGLRHAPRHILHGEPPSPENPPSGCVFHTRCPHVTARCREERPDMKTQGDGHQVACHLHR